MSTRTQDGFDFSLGQGKEQFLRKYISSDSENQIAEDGGLSGLLLPDCPPVRNLVGQLCGILFQAKRKVHQRLLSSIQFSNCVSDLMSGGVGSAFFTPSIEKQTEQVGLEMTAQNVMVAVLESPLIRFPSQRCGSITKRK
jgi:hypothetical protein